MKRDGFFELNALVAIAERKSFRAAAIELDISPSALSHAIAVLEKRLGVRLFNRTTRSVSLSEAGERFVARVQPALKELAFAFETINDFRDTPTGTLRINTTEPFAQQIFTPVVVEFLARYPDMNVELACDSHFVDIVKQGFDAGIRNLDSVAADMVAIPLTAPQQVVIVASPSLIKKAGRPKHPGDLLERPCVVLRRLNGGRYHWEFTRSGKSLELDVKGRLALDSLPLVIEAALRGLGFAYVNEHDVAGLLAKKKLVRVLDGWTPTWGPLALYYPGHRHVPAGLKAFVGVAKETLKARAAAIR